MDCFVFLNHGYIKDFGTTLHQLFSFIFVKLTIKNFLIWKEQLQLIDLGRKVKVLKSHIFYERPCQFSEGTKANEDFTSWKKDDNLIKSWIWGTLIEEVLYLASGLSTAKEVWKSLEEAFS